MSEILRRGEGGDEANLRPPEFDEYLDHSGVTEREMLEHPVTARAEMAITRALNFVEAPHQENEARRIYSALQESLDQLEKYLGELRGWIVAESKILDDIEAQLLMESHDSRRTQHHEEQLLKRKQELEGRVRQREKEIEYVSALIYQINEFSVFQKYKKENEEQKNHERIASLLKEFDDLISDVHSLLYASENVRNRMNSVLNQEEGERQIRSREIDELNKTQKELEEQWKIAIAQFHALPQDLKDILPPIESGWIGMRGAMEWYHHLNALNTYRIPTKYRGKNIEPLTHVLETFEELTRKTDLYERDNSWLEQEIANGSRDSKYIIREFLSELAVQRRNYNLERDVLEQRTGKLRELKHHSLTDSEKKELERRQARLRSIIKPVQDLLQFIRNSESFERKLDPQFSQIEEDMRSLLLL